MTKEFFKRGKQIAKWADNNMTKDEALKMAIENLEFVYTGDDDIHTAYYLRKLKETIQACKEALEQLKEPQYLYVSKGVNGKPELSFIDHQDVINKIKLEINNAM